MTTVACDGRTLAADSQWNSGGRLSFGGVPKIQKIDDSWYGAAGEVTLVNQFWAWLKGEGDPPECLAPEQRAVRMAAIELDPEGNIFLWYGTERTPIGDEFTAEGSGSDLAVGAMAAGADAIEAVEIACVFDSDTGGEVEYGSIY